MKAPRVDSFDPQAAEKAARLHQRKIAELASPLDNAPRIESPRQGGRKTLEPTPTLSAPLGETILTDQADGPGEQPGKTDLLTSKHVNKITNKQTNKQTYIQEALQGKATEIAGFRCPENVLAKVDEIKVLLRKKYGLKVASYELFTAALAAAFWEVEMDDGESDLIQALRGKGQK